MLKKVTFALQADTEESLKENLPPLFADLRQHDIEVTFAPICGITGSAGDNDMLYITDNELCYRALREQGAYILPYVHERNREADFEGALFLAERIEEMDYASIEMAYRRLTGLPWNILETKRCLIRESTVSDVDSFYQIYAEPSVTDYMENLFENRDEEIAYMQDYIRNVYYFYGYGMWTVSEKESGQIIGRAGISWREGFNVPELGFVIGVPWQRKGYACEVCRAILAYAADELGFTKIQALVKKGNQKSQNLCNKLGFKDEGEVVLNDDVFIRYLIDYQ